MKGDTFSRESSVETRNRNAGYARIAEGKKSAEDARARRVERTSSIHDIAELQCTTESPSCSGSWRDDGVRSTH